MKAIIAIMTFMSLYFIYITESPPSSRYRVAKIEGVIKSIEFTINTSGEPIEVFELTTADKRYCLVTYSYNNTYKVGDKFNEVLPLANYICGYNE